MLSSHHITPSLHHKMMSHAPQLLLDWSFPVSRYLSGKYHALFIMWSFLLCFIIFSLTLCHIPLSLLIIRPIPFPWQHFPFVSADSFVLMTHFISLTILPIVHTLFVAFVSDCHCQEITRNWTCRNYVFLLNFYFLMFLRLFPSMFPLLTYSQSFLFLIC